MDEHMPLFSAGDFIDTFWVAEDGEGTAGCIGLEVYDEAALLRSIVSAPRLRGTGLGGALTHRVLAEAERLGAKRVYLFTMNAAPFFTRMGFAVCTMDDFEESARQSTQYQALQHAPQQMINLLTAMRRDIP